MGEAEIFFVQSEIEISLVEQGKAHVERDVIGVAIAAVILSRRGREGTAGRFLLENDVDHARDGVGAVLRGGAVLQHFDMVDARGWYQRDVRGRAAGKARAARDIEIAGAMAALGIHQDQRVIGGKPAQCRRQCEAGEIGAGGFRGEGRHALAQSQTQIGGAGCLGQGVAAQDRDGCGTVGGRHALHAGAGDDHGFVRGVILRRSRARQKTKWRHTGAHQKRISQIPNGCRHGNPPLSNWICLLFVPELSGLIVQTGRLSDARPS